VIDIFKEHQGETIKEILVLVLWKKRKGGKDEEENSVVRTCSYGV
jgi:hypothetical protein